MAGLHRNRTTRSVSMRLNTTAILWMQLIGICCSCTCGGIVVTYVDGLQHCFEVVSGGQSWVNSDLMCANIGGHLAHIDTTEKESLLSSYIKQQLAASTINGIMIGATVGALAGPVVAFLCPGNSYYDLYDVANLQQMVVGTPTDEERCIFYEAPDYRQHYGACEQSSTVLCDRRKLFSLFSRRQKTAPRRRGI
uniref:C-type lectin domain-containing protein n=1 Tax=Plectus sambesii TaxID=2011161 RepID=A0A914XHJ4_9BILA